MKADTWQRECEVAVAAVREGARLACEIQRHFEGTLVKADRSPVSVADFAVQALITDRIGRAFPLDVVVAEEDSAALTAPAGQPTLSSVLTWLRHALPGLEPSSVLHLIDRGRAAPTERFWVLDPVDGTQGFLRGDQYVVALALIVREQVVVGVIGCPALRIGHPAGPIGWIAYAVRGRGAWALQEHRISPLHVSGHRDPVTARVLRSFEPAHIDLARFRAIVETLGVQEPPALMDSQAKHALIAAGDADLLVRVPALKTYRDKIWDQAAGSLIIEEAGGRVTDLNGAALNFGTGRLLASNEGLIASNGLLHDAVVEAIQGMT
ncbi:MAG TPA: inositol monophosphatase family protein [Vicinamibacterales bacterium]|jgi:3'(2'), 5'-bisphosphate nucleotidase